MSQTFIESYFATRKRSAVDEANIQRAKKVLILDNTSESTKGLSKGVCEPVDVIYTNPKKELFLNNNTDSNEKELLKFPERNRVITKLNFDSVQRKPDRMTIKRATPKIKHRKQKDVAVQQTNQSDIQKIFENMQNKQNVDKSKEHELSQKTPPTSPLQNAMDNVPVPTKDLSLNEIKTKLTRSSRLAELKASLSRFNKGAEKLKEIEKKTAIISQTSPTLKAFKSIELEVHLSPSKQVSPAKSYLSPKKDITSAARKNLFGSPVKTGSATSPQKVPAYQRFQALASPGKPSLTLPYKYRNVAEIFRSVDTVCAMLYNRKETITFAKLKPAVQEMMRRNLYLQHFAQIQSLYPNAFKFHWEKLKYFGCREEKWELVITPVLEGEEDVMNPTCLLDRRRNLFTTLIEKVKDYHEEFLQSLEPPLVIPRDKITRWHPEFDIEKIPDISGGDLPKQPEEEKISTGKEVLDKARSLFTCNARMEKALEKLKEIQETKAKQPAEPEKPIQSALKGIPKSLLEKVRAKQAAKALDAMTRSPTQDKESLMYSRLPEIARLLRNTFVAEKKGVLPLEDVIVKLNNSYRSHLTNSEIEEHLKLISQVVPGWIMFHEIRRTLFVKLSRDGDMSKVMARLEELAKQKCGT